MNRPRIAYLCDHSPLDKNLYSGGNARIYAALQAHVGDVTIVPNDWGMAEPVRKMVQALPDAITLRLRWRMHLMLQRVIARRVTRFLKQGDFDVLFGAYSLHSLAGVKVPPGMVVVYTSDATQTVYRLSDVGQAHRKSSWVSRVFETWSRGQEKQVLAGCDHLLWPSEWLRSATQELYDLPGNSAHLVPWGANIGWVPTPPPKTLASGAPLHLLVIGRNWWAKGGPMAFDTLRALRLAGVDARLTVIGCEPPDVHRNAFVTVHPQLDKAKPEELAIFQQTLEQAHFMVQPSFESYGFAFCEASAYGLPSLCLRVGGVPITEGVNGHALQPGATSEDYCRLILSYLDDPDSYARLSQSSRQEYETRLNWESWGQAVAQILGSENAQSQHTMARPLVQVG
jgi:glycosyltransferase involved in cell wall biosynthesis